LRVKLKWGTREEGNQGKNTAGPVKTTVVAGGFSNREELSRLKKKSKRAKGAAGQRAQTNPKLRVELAIQVEVNHKKRGEKEVKWARPLRFQKTGVECFGRASRHEAGKNVYHGSRQYKNRWTHAASVPNDSAHE